MMSNYIVAVFSHIDDTLTVETVEAVDWKAAVQHPMFVNIFEDFPFSDLTSRREFYAFASECELTVKVQEFTSS